MAAYQPSLNFTSTKNIQNSKLGVLTAVGTQAVNSQSVLSKPSNSRIICKATLHAQQPRHRRGALHPRHLRLPHVRQHLRRASPPARRDEEVRSQGDCRHHGSGQTRGAGPRRLAPYRGGLRSLARRGGGGLPAADLARRRLRPRGVHSSRGCGGRPV